MCFLRILRRGLLSVHAHTAVLVGDDGGSHKDCVEQDDGFADGHADGDYMPQLC